MIRTILELIQGIIIGAGAILPGISGASLAVVFGVYEEFTELLAHPLERAKPFLKKHTVLCIGIAAGFVVFTLLLGKLFDRHTTALVFLFSGFIAGTLPGIYTQAKKKGIGPGEIIAFALTAGVFIFAAVSGGAHQSLSAGTAGVSSANAGVPAAIHPVAWILSGAAIGAGSLLPGVSASFILIYFGTYGPLLDAVANREIVAGLLLGAGVLLSLALLSRLVNALYKRYHGIVSFAVLGSTLGSLILVFPGLPAGTNLWFCALLAASGFAASFFLDRVA